jgi:hypothetical protein
MILRHKDFKVLVAGWYSEKELKKYLKQMGLEIKLFRPQEEEDGLCRDIEINAPGADPLVINSSMETKQVGNCTSFHYKLSSNIARVIKKRTNFFGGRDYKMDVILYMPTIEDVIFYTEYNLIRAGKVIYVKIDGIQIT